MEAHVQKSPRLVDVAILLTSRRGRAHEVDKYSRAARPVIPDQITERKKELGERSDKRSFEENSNQVAFVLGTTLQIINGISGVTERLGGVV
jgi:hypothetical protein